MDRFRGLGGARKRGASGTSMGSVLSPRTSHRPRGRPFPRGWTWIVMAVPTTCELSTGRQNPLTRPRACSTPARNGAAEPRASPLYIGRGEELRCSCAPPCSRLPPPPPCVCSLAHTLEVRRQQRERLSAGAFSIGQLKPLCHKLHSQSVSHQAEECRIDP